MPRQINTSGVNGDSYTGKVRCAFLFETNYYVEKLSRKEEKEESETRKQSSRSRSEKRP